MSLIGYVPDVHGNTPKFGAPDVMETISQGAIKAAAGVSVGLVAAYYFEPGESGIGGSDGAASAGPYIDRSGAGNNATLLLGTTPVRSGGGGLQAADQHGFIVEIPGVAFPAAGMAIIAIQSTDGAEAGFTGPAWFLPKSDLGSATKSGNFSNSPAPHPIMFHGGVGDDKHMFIDRDSVQIPTANQLAIDPTVASPLNVNIMCWRWENTHGRVHLYSLRSGVRYSAVALQSFWDEYSITTPVFGLIPFGTSRPCTGRVLAFNLYNAFSDDAVAHEAMHQMAYRISRRGYTVEGAPAHYSGV